MKVAIHESTVRALANGELTIVAHNLTATQAKVLSRGLSEDWEQEQFPKSIQAILPAVLGLFAGIVANQASRGLPFDKLELVEELLTADERFDREYEETRAQIAAIGRRVDAAKKVQTAPPKQPVRGQRANKVWLQTEQARLGRESAERAGAEAMAIAFMHHHG